MEVLYWIYVKEQLEIFWKLQRREVVEQWLWFVEEDYLEDFLEDLGVVDDFLEFEEYMEFEGVDFREVVDFDVVLMFLSYEELV